MVHFGFVIYIDDQHDLFLAFYVDDEYILFFGRTLGVVVVSSLANARLFAILWIYAAAGMVAHPGKRVWRRLCHRLLWATFVR